MKWKSPNSDLLYILFDESDTRIGSVFYWRPNWEAYFEENDGRWCIKTFDTREKAMEFLESGLS